MRGCAPALTVHIKFFHRPGLPRAVVCISKSKIAQAEYKAKARFQALLRRSRFSRRSLREHRQTPFPFADDAKVQPKFQLGKQLFPIVRRTVRRY